jgi:hypothetical protein
VSEPAPPVRNRAPGVQLGPAVLVALRSSREGFQEWEVWVEGEAALAVAYPLLTPELQPGDRVLLNRTAVALGLGTGGYHFVVARLAPPSPAGPAETPPPPFPGRDAGHIMKLRYTPLQCRVSTWEESAAAAPGEAAFPPADLEGLPVLACELLSQAAAAALAARHACPELRLVLLHLDAAALPVAFSSLLAELRAAQVLDAVVSCGQSFGGDLEAINAYSGLLAARHGAAAGAVLVTQGPGSAGTGTRYGFSGMALLEALHAAAHLGGRPALAPRCSSTDPRSRHRGTSHHTATLLAAALCRVELPHPPGRALPAEAARHHSAPTEPGEWRAALAGWEQRAATMGRSPGEDPDFYAAACAAGRWLAAHRLPRPPGHLRG